MEVSKLLVGQIAIQIIMMLVGVIWVRAKLITKEGVTALSKLVLLLVMPCSILNSFQIDVKAEVLKAFCIAVIVSIVINIMFLIIARILHKTNGIDAVEQCSIMYPNCANMVIPLVAATIGPEWVIYCCPFFMVQCVFFFSIGVTLIREERKIELKKIICNVNMIAVVLGFILLFTNIKIPQMISSVMGNFASMIAPASMLVIGMSLGMIDYKDVFCNVKYYFLCVVRLLIMPLIVVLLIKVTGIYQIMDNMRTVLMIVVMGSASSAAAMITQTAQSYGKDGEKASAINMLTLIPLIVTMPLIIWIYDVLI